MCSLPISDPKVFTPSRVGVLRILRLKEKDAHQQLLIQAECVEEESSILSKRRGCLGCFVRVGGDGVYGDKRAPTPNCSEANEYLLLDSNVSAEGWVRITLEHALEERVWPARAEKCALVWLGRKRPSYRRTAKSSGTTDNDNNLPVRG